MINPSIAPKLALALVGLLLLSGCALMKPDIGLGSSRSASTRFGAASYGKPEVGTDYEESWVAARDSILDLAVDVADDAPDVLALRSLGTWRRDGAVLHDDAELLLDELRCRGLDYETASEVVIADDAGLTLRHVLLVRSGGALQVVDATGGIYLEGDDGWVAANIEAHGTTTRIVATGLDGPHAAAQAHELVDAMTRSTHPCFVTCGLDRENPIAETLRGAGLEVSGAAHHGPRLERGVGAPGRS